jgi:Amidohydrolase family
MMTGRGGRRIVLSMRLACRRALIEREREPNNGDHEHRDARCAHTPHHPPHLCNSSIGRAWRPETACIVCGDKLAKDPSRAFVPADAKAAWVRQPRPRDGYANVSEFLRKYSEAGGKILAATDTGCCPQIVPGLRLHYEMQMLTDLGIPPMKAIQGATLWSAEVIGQQKDLGSIEPGKLADFTIVEGNPLADIGATKNVRLVIKGGEVMDTAYDPKWVNPIPRRIEPAAQGPR